MTTTPIAPRGILAAFLLGLAVPLVGGQAGSGEATDDVLGGKLLVKLPYEVYRAPLFLEAGGPRLGVWVHDSNPAPAFFPGAPPPHPGNIDPKQQKGGAPPSSGPPFELFIWDVVAGKPLYHLTEKDAPPPYPSAGPMTFRAREPVRMIDYTPSGKNLVRVDAAADGTYIRLYDPQTHKWRSLRVSTGGGGVAQLLFAPNGDLVILNRTHCSVVEIGKSRPRRTFPLIRPGATVTPRGAPLGLAFAFADAALTPNGKTLGVRADGLVLVFDFEKGQPLWQLPKLSAVPGAMAGRLPASLAFSPAAGETKLLAVETVPDLDKGNFALVARYVDVKKKVELARAVLLEGGTFKPPVAGKPAMKPPQWGHPYAYFNSKGEPRVIADGKQFAAATGVVMHQTEGHRYVVSRDGQYAVRMTQVSPLDKAKMHVELWTVDRDR